MKIAIVVESTHHRNTMQLVEAISAVDNIRIINVENVSYDQVSEGWIAGTDVNELDAIGFASGAAYGKFYSKITKIAELATPARKRVFFLYTCGRHNKDYSESLCEALEEKGCVSLGSYGCLGFDTFGPLKLIGGIARNHPDEDEIQGAVDFYRNMINHMDLSDHYDEKKTEGVVEVLKNNPDIAKEVDNLQTIKIDK